MVLLNHKITVELGFEKSYYHVIGIHWDLVSLMFSSFVSLLLAIKKSNRKLIKTMHVLANEAEFAIFHMKTLKIDF